jgi:hypothetical protein
MLELEQILVVEDPDECREEAQASGGYLWLQLEGSHPVFPVELLGQVLCGSVDQDIPGVVDEAENEVQHDHGHGLLRELSHLLPVTQAHQPLFPSAVVCEVAVVEVYAVH